MTLKGTQHQACKYHTLGRRWQTESKAKVAIAAHSLKNSAGIAPLPCGRVHLAQGSWPWWASQGKPFDHMSVVKTISVETCKHYPNLHQAQAYQHKPTEKNILLRIKPHNLVPEERSQGAVRGQCHQPCKRRLVQVQLRGRSSSPEPASPGPPRGWPSPAQKAPAPPRQAQSRSPLASPRAGSEMQNGKHNGRR